MTCVHVSALASMRPELPPSGLPLPLDVPPLVALLPDVDPDVVCAPLLTPPPVEPELLEAVPEDEVTPLVVPDVDEEAPEVDAPPLEVALPEVVLPDVVLPDAVLPEVVLPEVVLPDELSLAVDPPDPHPAPNDITAASEPVTSNPVVRIVVLL
jgi:hypothetical protein